MFFLLKSEKWVPYRDYWFEVHGAMATTCIFGFLTVLMMPILFWIVRRSANGIQIWLEARTLTKFPPTFEGNSQSSMESILVIAQQSEIQYYPRGPKQKQKLLLGIALSKIYMIILSVWIYGLDQIRSDGFRCRNLKDGAEFLLSNNTPPAAYLNATFSQIWDMRKENGKDKPWFGDKVNGLFSVYLDEELNFSKTADLIESFNYRGFHDVCNALSSSDLSPVYGLLPGFNTRNATGTFIKNKLNKAQSIKLAHKIDFQHF